MHQSLFARKFIKRFIGYTGTIIVQIGFGLASSFVGLSVLSAADYGSYALVSLIVALLASLSVGPASAITAGRYLKAEAPEKARANATLLLINICASAAGAMLFYGMWPLIHVLLGASPDEGGRLFASACILFQAVTLLYTSFYYNEGSAGLIFAVTLFQAGTVLLCTWLGLYVFLLGPETLYLAQCLGFFAAAVLSAIVRWRQCWAPPSRAWFHYWRQSYAGYFFNTAISNLPQLIESALIARCAGLVSLAVWQHSRIYNAFIFKAGKTIGLSIWPISLEEARTQHFHKTRKAWRVVYVMFTVIGVGAVFLAEPVIAVLTHDKLTQASVFLPWWVIYNILQSSGREAEATLYSADHGVKALHSQSIAKMVSLVAMLPLIYFFGLMGIIAALLLEAGCFRLLLRRSANRIAPIPATDYWAFVGSLVIVMSMIAEHWLAPLTWPMRIAAVMISSGITLCLARKAILDVFLLYRSATNGVRPVSGENS